MPTTATARWRQLHDATDAAFRRWEGLSRQAMRYQQAARIYAHDAAMVATAIPPPPELQAALDRAAADYRMCVETMQAFEARVRRGR